MARRQGPPTHGRRYVGNSNNMEVYDLDNDKTGPNQCQIDEIIGAGHARIFTPDALSQAHAEGYDSCAYCLAASRR